MTRNVEIFLDPAGLGMLNWKEALRQFMDKKELKGKLFALEGAL